jgi:hypothetical protein
MYCGPSEQIALLQALDTKQQSHMKHGKCFAVHDCWRNDTQLSFHIRLGSSSWPFLLEDIMILDQIMNQPERFSINTVLPFDVFCC